MIILKEVIDIIIIKVPALKKNGDILDFGWSVIPSVDLFVV